MITFRHVSLSTSEWPFWSAAVMLLQATFATFDPLFLGSFWASQLREFTVSLLARAWWISKFARPLSCSAPQSENPGPFLKFFLPNELPGSLKP